MATSPIRLDDVAAPDQGERKFLLDAETACVVWRVIGGRLRPHHRDAERPLTFHRTTYFDTPDFAYYRGSGALNRRLRVREYATAAHASDLPILTGGCYLELKQSSGGRRAKTRLALPPDQVDTELERIGDGMLAPCLMTWYHRAALSDDSERLRVTLDSRLVYCRPGRVGGDPAGEPRGMFARGPDYILEIKAWGELPAWLVLMLRGLRESVGFSKFRAGMQAAEHRGLLGRQG
jgi:hypothetical protein